MISVFLIHGRRKHRIGCIRFLPLFPKINQIDLWRGHLISNIRIDATVRSDSLRNTGLTSSKKRKSKNTLQSSELLTISLHSSSSNDRVTISNICDLYFLQEHNSSVQRAEAVLVLLMILLSTQRYTDTIRLDQIRHHSLLSNTHSLRNTALRRRIFINSLGFAIRE